MNERRVGAIVICVVLACLCGCAYGPGAARRVDAPEGTFAFHSSTIGGDDYFVFLSLKKAEHAVLWMPGRGKKRKVSFMQRSGPPAFDCTTGTVFFGSWDGERYGIAEWRFEEDGTQPRVIYHIPSSGVDVHWMILTPDAETLYFLIGPREGTDRKNVMMKFDREKRTVARAFAGKGAPLIQESPLPVCPLCQ